MGLPYIVSSEHKYPDLHPNTGLCLLSDMDSYMEGDWSEDNLWMDLEDKQNQWMDLEDKHNKWMDLEDKCHPKNRD